MSSGEVKLVLMFEISGLLAAKPEVGAT